MHILVTNDDGPPSNQSSPYVHSLVHTLQKAGHTVSVILPHQQRSWIGKAHLVGASVTPTYFRPGTLHRDDGTIHPLPRGSGGEGDKDDDGGDEWVLIDSTPASCVQIGLHHYFQDRGPVDLVVSGPNYGRNTTALFALSSGTIGGAMEAAVCGKKAIALSYAFSSRNHDPVVIAEASEHSVRLIEYLYANWADGVDLYSINVPLEPGMSKNKIQYTSILDNRWKSGSCFEAVDPVASGLEPGLQEQNLRESGEGSGSAAADSRTNPRPGGLQHKHFKWAPKFADVYRSVDESEPGNDGWVVKHGMTSVTPLRANFMHATGISGEIKLPGNKLDFYYLIDYEDKYVQPLLEEAFHTSFRGWHCHRIQSLSDLPESATPVFQFRTYEAIDFEHVYRHPRTSLANSFVIRKALIRKHFLSNTLDHWVAKYPDSSLRGHFKPAVAFELDYAEYLDEAFQDAYELKESLDRNQTKSDAEKEWWILKPGMSDRGQGIRLFSTEEQLRGIFEEWEAQIEDDDDDDGEQQKDGGDGVIISNLRHFIAQPYIDPPLLLPSATGRKFHLRTYVLAVGSLKVYVFREMLALFAEKPYQSPRDDPDDLPDLMRHLTNTCLQEKHGGPKEGSVRRFWTLDDTVPGLPENWKNHVFDQVCEVTGQTFEAAARGMMVHFQTLPNVFEVFGLDFLVDHVGNVWILEVNAFPDFGQTGEELKRVVVGRLFSAVMEVAVRPFFEALGAAVPSDPDMRLVADLDLGRT